MRAHAFTDILKSNKGATRDHCNCGVGGTSARDVQLLVHKQQRRRCVRNSLAVQRGACATAGCGTRHAANIGVFRCTNEHMVMVNTPAPKGP